MQVCSKHAGMQEACRKPTGHMQFEVSGNTQEACFTVKDAVFECAKVTRLQPSTARLFLILMPSRQMLSDGIRAFYGSAGEGEPLRGRTGK